MRVAIAVLSLVLFLAYRIRDLPRRPGASFHWENQRDPEYVGTGRMMSIAKIRARANARSHGDVDRGTNAHLYAGRWASRDTE